MCARDMEATLTSVGQRDAEHICKTAFSTTVVKTPHEGILYILSEWGSSLQSELRRVSGKGHCNCVVTAPLE